MRSKLFYSGEYQRIEKKIGKIHRRIEHFKKVKKFWEKKKEN